MRNERHGIVYRILRGVKRAFDRSKRTIVNLAKVPGFLTDPARSRSYFPGEEKKSRTRIWLENLLWIIRHNELNEFYFAFGLDRKHGSRSEQYMAGRAGQRLINRLNAGIGADPHGLNYRCMCRDKLVFGAYLTALGFPTPRILAVYDGHQLFWLEPGFAGGLEHLLDVGILDVFCKDSLGAHGKNIFPLKVESGHIFIDGQESAIQELKRRLSGPTILQERLTQHRLMVEIYPPSINTIRLVTVLRGNEVKLLGAFVRCGTEGRCVDNWGAGGIAVSLDQETGKMHKKGIFAPGKGGFVTAHPETGFRFEGFEVPFYRAAVEMTMRLHRFFYGLATIGWDIALAPDGPVFIEGNDRWEVESMQAVVGGFKTEFLQMMSSPQTGR